MYIVVDIGGTKTRVAQFADFDSSVEVIEKFPTASTAEEGMAEIARCIQENVSSEVLAIVVGIAGVVDGKEKKLLSGPNLSGWIGKSLTTELEAIVSPEQVFVVNDTDLGGLGEATAGAGSNEGITAFLTVGTGVGGSRIVDGRIDRGRFGFEPGHQIIDLSDFLAAGDVGEEEGNVPGHLEYYLSGRNIEARSGKAARDITDEGMWAEFQQRLIAALNNVIIFWSPDVIVLGGSMIIRNEYLSFAYMQKELEKRVHIFPEVPTLQRAVLQDDAGLIGGKEFLRQQVNV